MHKICEACQFGKQARKPFPGHVQDNKKPLELIHSDVWTTKAASIGGCHYFVTFIDDYSRKVVEISSSESRRIQEDVR